MRMKTSARLNACACQKTNGVTGEKQRTPWSHMISLMPLSHASQAMRSRCKQHARPITAPTRVQVNAGQVYAECKPAWPQLTAPSTLPPPTTAH